MTFPRGLEGRHWDQGVLKSTWWVLPSEALLARDRYLPEDSGCQRLVGQEKTHYLREKKGGEPG